MGVNYNLEIQKILLKVDQTTNPDDKITLLKQAIQVADSNNDLDWGFDLRLDLIFHEKDTSHCVESFPAFAWILNTYDNNPELFNEDDFLWEYKWMCSSARRNVNISKAQIENIMEDMKTRMEHNGYSLRGYYSVRLYWNLSIGNLEKAKEYVERIDESTRDRMSHCQACELDSKVHIKLLEGKLEEALTEANDLITKKLTCSVVPLRTFCDLTYHFSEVGDLRATEFFNKAVEELAEQDAEDSSLIDYVSDLIPYLTKNDKEKAWEYFQKYAHWEIGAEDLTSFYFSARILPLLKEESKKTLEMNPKLSYFREDGQYDLQELYNYYYKKATSLAEKFDERNETNHITKKLEYILQ